MHTPEEHIRVLRFTQEQTTAHLPLTTQLLRGLLQQRILEKRARGFGRRLALELRCTPAYITRLLKGGCFLSCEQAYALSRFLRLNERDTHWLILAASRDRAGTFELRKHFESILMQYSLEAQSPILIWISEHIEYPQS